MNRRTLISLITLLVILLLGSLVTASCGSGQEETAPPTEQEQVAPPSLDGQSLVQERCTECHSLGRVTGAQKTEEEWRTTVQRMVGKGANLNSDEQEAVIQYLTETYPE
jgi:cytochrome c5